MDFYQEKENLAKRKWELKQLTIEKEQLNKKLNEVKTELENNEKETLEQKEEIKYIKEHSSIFKKLLILLGLGKIGRHVAEKQKYVDELIIKHEDIKRRYSLTKRNTEEVCGKIENQYSIISTLEKKVQIALELALSGSNKYIKRVQENEQNSIRDFKNLIKEIEICRLDVSEENKKYIDKLYEKMRYSDPVSSPEVAQENEKIHELIAELTGITESSQFEAKCLEIEKQLDIRKIKNTKEQG